MTITSLFSVYIQNLDISIQSLFNRPFGYGLNNYHIAFDEFFNISRKNHINLKAGQKLNFTDGSNNLFKSIVEIWYFCNNFTF